MSGAEPYELLVVIHQVSGPPLPALQLEFIVSDHGPCGTFMVLCREPQAYVKGLLEDARGIEPGSWYKIDDP